MIKFILSPLVDQIYPGAYFGFLAVDNVTNPPQSMDLEVRKTALQKDLRALYTDEVTIQSDPVIQAYASYYRRFKKNYHVAFQLESVAIKEKPIPTVAVLVECMFMAELNDRLLTAGHDLNAIQGDVTVNVASGSEKYTILRGLDQQVKPRDLFMSDEAGVISSIMHGPDARTQISASTTRALFAVYAPPGVGQMRVQDHLARILDYVRVVCPDARVLLERVI